MEIEYSCPLSIWKELPGCQKTRRDCDPNGELSNSEYGPLEEGAIMDTE